MATYTVNISGTFNQTYGYLTINGTKITTAGTRTYSSKPTIKAFVSSSQSNLRSKCYVSHNGTVLKSGYGEYTLSIDAETMDIKMLQIQDASTYLYYAVEITTKVPSEPHNTNIGGIAREFESGTVLIGGVLREIESGLVLVNGVAREIAFGSGGTKNYTVTITGSGAKDSQTPYACLVIDLNVYVAAQTIELPAGTVISCRVGRGTRGQAAVLLNGTAVAETAENYGEAWYDYTVNGNTTISLEVGTGAIIRITTS